MEELKAISEISGFGLAALAIAFVFWVLKYKKNGVAPSAGITTIKDDVALIKSNHLAHIQSDLDKISDGINKLMSYQDRQIYILQEIKDILYKNK